MRWTMYRVGPIKPHALHDTPSVVPTEPRPKSPLSDREHGSLSPHTRLVSKFSYGSDCPYSIANSSPRARRIPAM